jgi:hypothetical protein
MLASAALASGGLLLAVPAATAAPVFTDANTHLDPDSNSSAGSGTCNVTETPGPNTTVPVVENGAPATATGSMHAVYGNSGATSDTATGDATDTATGSVSSVGGTLRSLDFTGSGTVSLDQALATSACQRDVSAWVVFNFDFTLTQPGYLHVKMSNTGGVSYGEVDLWQHHATGDQPYVDHYGQGLKFNGTDDVFLPAGEYRGYFYSYVSAFGTSGTTDFSGTGKTTVHATFNVAGSQTAAQTGAGHRYVGFAAARACATHSLDAMVTHRKKLAHRIKKISFFVNGTKVRTLRHPHRGRLVSLAIADDQAASVMAKVKLTDGKVRSTTASYEACS